MDSNLKIKAELESSRWIQNNTVSVSLQSVGFRFSCWKTKCEGKAFQSLTGRFFLDIGSRRDSELFHERDHTPSCQTPGHAPSGHAPSGHTPSGKTSVRQHFGFLPAACLSFEIHQTVTEGESLCSANNVDLILTAGGQRVVRVLPVTPPSDTLTGRRPQRMKAPF